MQNEKIVYLVRHGQSADNIAPVFQAPDSPLSDVGEVQVQNMAQRVAKLSFETLLASPLPRAKQTAQAIEKVTSKVPEFSDLFVESRMPSSIHGKSYDDERANMIWREWKKSKFTLGMIVEDGENYEALLERADEALEFLRNQKEESMVVVTHGYFLRTIVARVLLGTDISADAFKTFQKSLAHENTGITVLRYRAGFEEPAKWRLWIYNDHAHLAG